jgi:hypothetical protein
VNAWDTTQREWLREFCRWEEYFILRIGQLAAADEGPLPSRKQADIIRSLAARLGYATDEPVRLPPEANEDDGYLEDVA